VAQLVETQLVQVLQIELLQQLDWHCPGGVPPMTQVWKQPISWAQLLLSRQFSVWVQQLLTMHWLQGVPPGSREQLPPSTGTPQWPPWHTIGEQHWGVVWQLDPWGRQEPSPQIPAVHRLLQHSDGELQEKPSSLQIVPGTQTLFSQVLLQHSKPLLQKPPSGVQPWMAQRPELGSQKLLQHSGSKLQNAPLGKQVLNPQRPELGSQ